MKPLPLTLLFFLLIASLYCAPLRNIETELKQPDGSTLRCFMTGDEYYHRMHDAGGYTIVLDPSTGYYVYASRQEQGLIPTALIPGVDDPGSHGLKADLLPDASLLRHRSERFRGAYGDNYGRAPTTGTINNLCIFIRFADQPFNDALALYDNMYNSTTSASMKGFFLEESASQLSVSTTFYPDQPGGIVIPYVDPNVMAYYQPASAVNPIGYPAGLAHDPEMYGYMRLHSMLINAIGVIAPQVPPGLNIDADNDGSVDNISFICSGNADGSGILWPHYWVLDAYPTTPLFYINGKQADDYNFEPQLPDPMYGGGVDTAVVCHEFSHTLGFPDLYHYSFDGLNPCGYWDLMDWCLGTPQHHLTYMKWKYGGWFTAVPALPPSGVCSLNAVAYSPFDCYRYQMPTGEQIWIEYRRNVGNYESRTPGSGLVIYRVDQSLYPYGNAGGPPDEVYVYRPYVSSGLPDGNIAWAQYAWEQSHSAINSFTDPAPFSQSMPGFMANLNIYSIGSNLGPQITFEVGNQIPVIWTGAVDRYWYNSGNWTTGAVPLATDLVIVGPGQMYGCEIPLSPGLGAVCNDLRVEHSLQMWPGASLQVGGNLHSIGRIFMDGNLLQVAGDLTIGYWYSGSWLQCTTFPIAQIRVGGNCLFETGTSVLLSVGQLIFYNPSGGGTQTFTVDAIGTRFNDIVVNNMGRTLDYNSMIVQFPPVTIAGSLTVAAGAVLNLTSPQMINIDGNLIVDPAGVFRATLGTIYLTGNPGPQSVNVANPMSFFNDLTVNTNTGLVTNLLSNITVRGNFSIDNGALAANNHILSIQGNWLNNVGTGAFQKGMSRVIFGGSGNQHIVVTSPAGAIQEDFHILELANTPGNLILNTPGQQVQCDIYDHTAGTLVVSDGVFTALDLADMSLTGGFTCNAPGMMNLTDFSANADLSGNLTIHGGTINVSIGNPVPGSVSTWGIQPGSVTIDSGQLCFINTGVNVIPGGALFSTNITGGTISSAGDFTVFRPEFSPSGGIVTLNGSHPAQIAATGGGYFHNVRSAVSTLTTLANVQVNGNIIVDGSSSFNVGNNLHIAGQLSIAGTLSVNSPAILTLLSAEVTGSLSINSGAEMQTGTEIDIQAGGSFTSAGVSGNPAKLKGYSGAYWKMQVSGTIYADKTEFLHLHANGIWVNPTGTVDVAGAFSDCLFTQGQSGDCTFLTLNNSQDLTLNGINFTSGGGESYNLAKTVNTGSVTVSSSSGDFAGPLYENDPHTRIAWVGYDPNLIVETFTVSDPVPYVADQISYHVVIKNDSANPVQSTFRIHLFKNQASAPGWSDTGDYYHECPTLSPNATHSFDFTQLYSMTDESWISWLLIDPESAITETSETDNLDSEAVTWQALPEVDPVSLATTGSNSARVSWSYPIWVTRYRIYECDDPYGTFWYHGQTTASFFDITLSGDRLFYQVKAERDDPFPSK